MAHVGNRIMAKNMNTVLGLAGGVVLGRYLRKQLGDDKNKDYYLTAALPGSLVVPGKIAGAVVAGVGCAGLASLADEEIIPMFGNGNGNGTT